jgi:outer membrane protein assembly factor BamD
MVDPEPMSATEVARQANRAALGDSGKESQGLAVETVGSGAPPPNEAAPRSDTPPVTGNAAQPPADAATDSNELKANQPAADANVPADPNELKPNVASDSPAPPPLQQVNQIGADSTAASSSASADSSSSDQLASDNDISSSKPKKKKGLEKLNPF